MRLRRGRRGFTLAQLLVASVSLAVIATIMLTVTLAMYRAFAILIARAVVTDTLRNAMEQIGRDVQSAKQAVTQCGIYKTTAPVTALLILEYPDSGVLFIGGGGPTTGDHVIYRCRSGGTCSTGNPGPFDALERLVVRSTAPGVCDIVLTPNSNGNYQTIALQVESVSFPTTLANTVKATLRVQRGERGFVASSAITDLFRFRGK